LAANEFKGTDFPFSQIVCFALLTPKHRPLLGAFFWAMVYQVSGSEKIFNFFSVEICTNQKYDSIFAKVCFTN